jgi:hypothetical protein
MRNGQRKLLRQSAGQRHAKDFAEPAVIPNRALPSAGEAFPKIIADVAVVVQNRLRIIDLVGKRDEER